MTNLEGCSSKSNKDSILKTENKRIQWVLIKPKLISNFKGTKRILALLDSQALTTSCKAQLRKEHSKTTPFSRRLIKNQKRFKETDLLRTHYMKRLSEERQSSNKKRRKYTNNMRNKSIKNPKSLLCRSSKENINNP